jgi:hypothetical protein
MTVRECDQLPPAAARREEEEEGDGAGDQVGRNADAPRRKGMLIRRFMHLFLPGLTKRGSGRV